MPAIKEADSAAEVMSDLCHFHGRRATATAHLDGSRVVMVVDGLWAAGKGGSRVFAAMTRTKEMAKQGANLPKTMG